MLIASAKSQSTRGASHQPVFIGSCLTISHTCLLFLPSRRVSPCVLCPLTIRLMHNGGSVDALFAWYDYSSVESYCYSREWLWNTRAKIHCMASGK